MGSSASYPYGDPAHADVATSIGSGGSTGPANYDAAGNLTCRAPSGAPTGATLAYDNQGQLAAWQNAPSSPTSTDSPRRLATARASAGAWPRLKCAGPDGTS